MRWRTSPVTIQYAVYGELNSARDNAILVCHALSGSAEVADWWPELLTLIAASTSTAIASSARTFWDRVMARPVHGPSIPRPARSTGRISRWSRSAILSKRNELFSIISESIAFNSLSAARLAACRPCSGPWISHRVANCISIAAAPLGPMGLALNHLQRQVIRLDAKWKNGDYGDDPPVAGLALARKIAMCSYKSAELFSTRFGRNPTATAKIPGRTECSFRCERLSRPSGRKIRPALRYELLSQHHPNHDTFDPIRKYGIRAYERIQARVTLVGISSDWLFPASEVRSLAGELRSCGVDCNYCEIESSHGHDAFLAEPDKLASILASRMSPGNTLG